MKKALIGTTALFAVGLLNVAAAQAADKISLGLSGSYNTGIGFSSQDDGVNDAGADVRSHAIMVDSEINFAGATTLDNGIEVGFRAELEIADAGTTDYIDEHFVYFENMDVWGRVEMGDRDGAEAKTMVFGPLVNGNTITGLSAFNWRSTPGAANLAGGPLVLGGLVFLADSTKITYYTPKFSGLQLGVSYTPQPGAENAKALAGEADLNALGEGKAVGANWTGSLGDASVRASAGWSSADAESALSNDRTQWSTGINISMSGWQFGGGYVKDETGGGLVSVGNIQRDDVHYRLGLVYSSGPYTSGLEYAVNEEDTATGEDSVKVWSIQGKKSLGAGVSVGGGVRQWSWEDADSVAASEHDATEYFFLTSVSF
jgi:outer membrane protein OmpU